jgi:hypothetical protein
MTLNRPWLKIAQLLQEKYTIVAEVDLLKFDSNPQLLYHALKLAYKECYKPNDRILIYHYDTDFYYAKGSPGFTISNLMTCLKLLDISVNFCLLLTNHYGISNEINQLSSDHLDMPIFESNYQLLQTTPTPIPINININKIKKSYICLNGAKRSHRVLFLSYLKEYQLLNSGILSWHFDSLSKVNKCNDDDNNAITNYNIAEIPESTIFLTTTPFTRVNDRFYIDTEGREIFNRHCRFFQNNWKDSTIAGEANQNTWNIPAVQEAFLYVSIETVLQYPYPYLTEKTFRAILHKRPFVILGAPGCVAQIKKLGFKTFNSLWSEGYDLIEDPNDRIRAVVKIVKEIGSLSSDQLKDLMYSIQDVVEFNYKFYVEEFSGSILDNRLNTI